MGPARREFNTRQVIVPTGITVIGEILPGAPTGRLASSVRAAGAAQARLLEGFRAPADRPRVEIALHDVGQRCDPLVPVVKARYVAQLAAPRFEKERLSFDRDLFERLEAVRNEPRADHIDRIEPLPAE